MKCELQVIRETWRVRTDFERIAGCFRYVNDQTTDRAGFLVHKILFLVLNSRIYCGRSPHGERGLKCDHADPPAPRLVVAPHTGSVD